MSPFERQLDLYAELAVRIGVNLQPGQRLIVNAPINMAPLVRLIAKHAYQQGARLVDVLWSDDEVTLARYLYAPRDSFDEVSEWQAKALLEHGKAGQPLLQVSAQNPDLLKGQDTNLVAMAQKSRARVMEPYIALVTRDAFPWSIVGGAEPTWAARVFPNLPAEEQVLRLWEAIFQMCRLDQPDPVGAWQAHTQSLVKRSEYLTRQQYTTLKLKSPQSDLTVGLPAGHIWKGGIGTTPMGIPFAPNLPTEEIFTLPHRDRVDGVVRTTKPLSVRGVLLNDFTLRFEGGRVVAVSAPHGEDVLRKVIETDEGAAHLGEIALVPASSPISKSGLLFYNTLFDENAASHIALGDAYRFNLAGADELSNAEFAARGGNHSLIHVDFMIGSTDMDVDGVRDDGTTEPVMRAGEWAFEV
ncbi:MAG: aminopeptidase [Anaerolineae bacterium]|nr:aminopeptidase [Anaerolineae bacterium]